MIRAPFVAIEPGTAVSRPDGRHEPAVDEA
jgi:hypothetical protein